MISENEKNDVSMFLLGIATAFLRHKSTGYRIRSN
jgi:hypothetical protein